MAMNESVASTCCYRVLARSGDLLFKEVLSGGYIGSATFVEQEESAEYPLNAAWMSLVGDYPAKYTGLELRVVNGVPTAVEIAEGKEVLTPLTSINTFLSGGSACGHDTNACAYYAFRIVALDEAHIDATLPHTGVGARFDRPHAAMQFTS